MRKSLCLLALIFIFSGCMDTETEDIHDNGSISSRRVTPDDLEYLGAFRLPDGTSETGTWEWGGTAMTYFPGGDSSGGGDGYPGSIFGAGHAWEHQISEINIPVPVISSRKSPSDLNTAETIQGFTDVLDVGEYEIPRTGIEYISPRVNQTQGKLCFCVGKHNQEGSRADSHGIMNLDLSHPLKKGLWKINGYLNYVTNDYMFAIPETWADENIGGKRLATGRFRDGGQGAMGPSLIAISPWIAGTSPPEGTVLEANALLLYENAYLENPRTMNDYHHSDEWSGGAWITSGEKAAIVFVGTKGVGDCWYGFSNGVIWAEPYPPVPDYPHDDRGWWSSEFRACFLFYDPSELEAVAAKRMNPWEPQPYACVDMGKHLFNGNSITYETDRSSVLVQRKYRFGGCSYDRRDHIFFVFELFADGAKPIIHSWRVN